jgi:hypothetical protein
MTVLPTNITPIGHNRLDYIERQIRHGFQRMNAGGAEWVEGALQTAEALREGRDAVPSDIGFGAWLKQKGLDTFPKNERTALINLASDIEIARTVLTETKSRSFRLIWQENRSRFPSSGKPRTSKPKRRYVRGRAKNFREMKLGAEAIARIKNTSLDSACEIDELVRMNRGTLPGEVKLTAEVEDLISRAERGEDVSALARSKRQARPELISAWSKRMTHPWQRATQEERFGLFAYILGKWTPEERDRLIQYLWDKFDPPKGDRK